MALLRSIYGPGAEKLRLDKRTFTTPTNKSVDINMITSNYHIELCPGDAGLNDRYVVQDVIKEMAQSKSIATAGTTTEAGPGKKASIEYKVVILVEVDRLSRQAQAALRRTMEKYTTSCRLILICNNPSKVIDPVRSRCLGIRVPSPSHDQVSAILSHVQLHIRRYGLTVVAMLWHIYCTTTDLLSSQVYLPERIDSSLGRSSDQRSSTITT
jgi:replication factor C subunit 3/5